MSTGPSISEKQRQQMEALDQAIDRAVGDIKHRIIVFSGKGGVGKTTVSVSLALALQRRGHKSAILDADITGPNIPKMLGLGGSLQAVDEQLIPETIAGTAVVSLANAIPADQPVMWRGPMRSKILYQFLGGVRWGKRDFMVADLPPGTGDEIMTLADKMKPDLAIVVTTPQEVSLIDSRRAINMAKEIGVSRIAVIENMSGFKCPDCGREIDLFGSGGGEKQAKELDVIFLGKLPVDIKARQMADNGHLAEFGAQESDMNSAVNAIAEKIETMLAKDN